MEEASRAKVRPAKNLIKSALVFENELKERLTWNKQQWIEARESGSKLHKLSNSLHYWKSRLKPALEDTSIVITLYNSDKEVKADLFEIITAVENSVENCHVIGVASFRNPRYVCLYFKSREERNAVREQFRMIADNYVVYMAWALDNDSSIRTLKVHWLPMTFDIEKIKADLGEYVECVEQVRKNIVFMSGRDMPTGKVEFKVKFKKNVTADIIPHVMEIGKMEALITIRGRQNLCLNCDCLGHISRECKLRFCPECRVLKLKTHECEMNRSYANIVKAGCSSEVGYDPKEWEDDRVLIKKTSVSAEKILLSEKINKLENQIKATQMLQEPIEQLKKEKKRKADSCNSNSADDSSENSVESIDDDDFEVSSGGQIEETIENDEGEIVGEEEEKDEHIISEMKTKKKETASKKKKKPKVSAENLKSIQVKVNSKDQSESDMILRSYGKPMQNARKYKQELKFNKVSEVREFIFQD